MVVAVVLLGLLVGLAALAGASSGGDLDPGSAAPEGSRAVAEVAADLGVDVVRTTTTAATTRAVREAGAGSTTVLLAATAPLSPGQLEDLASTGGALVLVEPPEDVLAALAPGLEVAGSRETVDAVPPQCDAPDAVAAGPASGGGVLVDAVDGQRADVPVTFCYGVPLEGSPYAALDVPATGGAPAHRVVVLGQGDVLRNRALAQEGNAALALRTIGAHEHLVWYLPDPLDPALGASARPGLLDLLPPGVLWGAAYLAAAGVGLLLWRGRRLGRLVPERLPVVVRATETLEGRSRLYRSTQARGHAAATLRAASLVRLARRLGLPATGDPRPVVDAAAAACGRPPGAVGDLYLSPPPRDDAGLVRLADALDTLEKEVRRP